MRTRWGDGGLPWGILDGWPFRAAEGSCSTGLGRSMRGRFMRRRFMRGHAGAYADRMPGGSGMLPGRSLRDPMGIRRVLRARGLNRYRWARRQCGAGGGRAGAGGR